MRQSVLVRVNPNRDERRRKAREMEMERISEATYRMLMRQGLARGLAGTRSRGTKVASAPLIGEEDDGPERSPTAGGMSADLNSRKGPAVNAPAKFTGLHVVVDNSRCMPLRDPTRSAQRGSGIHLVLV